MRGKFITLEGPDGAGKTTQIKVIAAYLGDKGYQVMITREPGGTSLGEQVRALLLDPKNDHLAQETEALLYGAARAQLVAEEIRPALSQGKMVLCDRFSDSTIAYQGFGRGMDKQMLQILNRLATGGLEPDLTILLDLEPEVGLQRIRESRKGAGGGQDRMEREALEFHKRVREGYLDLARENPQRFAVIPAQGDEAEVAVHIRNRIDRFLKVTDNRGDRS